MISLCLGFYYMSSNGRDTLPDFFPLVDKQKKCKGVTENFFKCFEEKGTQEIGKSEPKKGEKVFTDCKKELKLYEDCIKKVKGDQNLRLVRAPQAYLEQLKEE